MIILCVYLKLKLIFFVFRILGDYLINATIKAGTSKAQ